MLDRHFVALIALTLLAAVATARSAEADTVHSATFGSVSDAVLNASRSYNPMSVREDREFMGGIFRQTINGEILFGYTVSGGTPSRDRITVRIRLPQGGQLVAIWHTHGSVHWRRSYFSSTDTRLAETTGVPIFLATGQGELRVFKPGDPIMGRPHARRMGLGDSSGVASGKLLRSDIPVSL
ncbi:MAG: DUF4329 domain-containing protein [Pseudohongiella sp.]|uniref:DUF4329 domain-containing protein n=1 Tax=Pseudohongiella sp. TaxID=1979412 RepID=UPI0034A04A35